MSKSIFDSTLLFNQNMNRILQGILFSLTLSQVAGKVQLSFFGEAEWPECQNAVVGPLNETINAQGVLDAIEFKFIPWGNAYYNTKKCYTPQFDKENGMICWVKDCASSNPNPSPDCYSAPILCQHGQEECDADRLEGCVIDLYPEPFVHGNFIDFHRLS